MRLERVRFSIPYADASQALLIRAADKDKVKVIGDMSGKILAVKLGSPGETMKNRLPMPSICPALSVTVHEIVCSPLVSVVVSRILNPIAPFVLA